MKKILGAKGDSKSPLSFYLTDFLFRKIFRHNNKVKWPVHFTSTIHTPERLFVGENTFPGDSPGVYINAYNKIFIGDYTNIGPKVSIISADHDFIDNEKHTEAMPVIIGKRCWIGSNSVILPEVILGDYTIVGAGSIVTKSFESGYCVIAGNPAKVIRKLEQTLRDKK